MSDNERYQLYGELAACPVGRSEAHGGFWILARYDDVLAAEIDWATFSSAAAVIHPVDSNRRAAQVALEQDPPQHTGYRRLYAELLSRAAVRAAEPFVRAVVRRGLAGLAGGDGGDSGDFVGHVAVPVPIETIAHLLGLDPEPTRQLRTLSESAWAALHRPAQTMAAPRAGVEGGADPQTLGRLLRERV